MADANSTVVPDDSAPKYSIDLDAYDKAMVKLEYLDAMLLAITCDGFPGFQTMNNKSQETYLYALSDVVQDIKTCLKSNGSEGGARDA